MLQPMAAGAIGGLALGIFVALFFMPCLYVMFTKSLSTKAISEVFPDTVALKVLGE